MNIKDNKSEYNAKLDKILNVLLCISIVLSSIELVRSILEISKKKGVYND